MKREKKAERDTALWLNDDQESLLVEHKRRIKRREDHRRAEQERWREDKRRTEQERRREDKRRAEQERRREEQRGEREWQEEQRRERERWKDQQRAVEIVDALSGLGEQRRRRYWTQRPTEQEITGHYEPDSNPLWREEQQRERKRQEEQQREWRRFSDLSEKAMNPKISSRFPLPELNEGDIQLVGKWYKPPLSSLDRKLLIENHGEDPELARLLSARSAEKTAMDFYQNQKYVREVEDISITQIKENNDPDWEKWKKYDLNVDGCPIDVKNSRQSPKSKDRYTEHCIPSFKRIERTNQEVRIAGVFSPYLSAFELLDKPTEDHGGAEILFLGETTLASLQKLKSEFKDLVESPSRIESPSSGYFLLPWVFDYPKYIYTEQDNARKELKDFSNFALLKESTLKFDLIPVGIAAGIDLMEILDNEDLDCWEWNFLDLLSNRIKKYGLSLPFIFLTILAHFLKMAASDERVSGFKPDKYRRLLFYKRRSNNPLGIYDPLGTIDALIEALNTLWIAEKGLIRSFSVFKLRSSNILLGKSNNETSWTTLIAYCGGCGKNPLVLGKSKLCECRRLICPNCDFCCDDNRNWTTCRCKHRRYIEL